MRHIDRRLRHDPTERTLSERLNDVCERSMLAMHRPDRRPAILKMRAGGVVDLHVFYPHQRRAILERIAR